MTGEVKKPREFWIRRGGGAHGPWQLRHEKPIGRYRIPFIHVREVVDDRSIRVTAEMFFEIWYKDETILMRKFAGEFWSMLRWMAEKP